MKLRSYVIVYKHVFVSRIDPAACTESVVFEHVVHNLTSGIYLRVHRFTYSSRLVSGVNVRVSPVTTCTILVEQMWIGREMSELFWDYLVGTVSIWMFCL
jgi:hypothetical protein